MPLGGSSLKRVVGIGSPHGHDRVGWLLIERLSKRSDVSATVVRLSTPLELLDHLEECEFLLVVDACQTGAVEGSVIRLDWPDRRIQTHQSLSSHGMGIGESLQLAKRLGRLPEQVVLLCLEVREGMSLKRGNEESIPGMDEFERRAVDELQSSQFE